MRILLAACIALGSGQRPVAQAPAAGLEFLDNGAVRVGLSRDHGGAIAYLGRSGADDNLVNVHDLGRYVQQSYYSGPKPFLPEGARMHPGWPEWGWNPIQAGDVFGNRPRLLSLDNDGERIVARCVPMQWALDGTPGECVFETEVRLEANCVHLRMRLENARADRTRYPAAHQELPAVYTIGRLHRLFTYTGERPFTGDAPTEIQNVGPPWQYWTSTEHWSALVDDDGFGVGVFHDSALLTVGGFHGARGKGGPADGATGYIAPLHSEILDHDIEYEARATLIVGDLDKDIRAYAQRRHPEPRPDLSFSAHRAHCVPHNLSDDAPPFSGSWRLALDHPDPQIQLPPLRFEARLVPKLHIRAAYRTKAKEAELYFAAPGEEFTGERRVAFRIQPDGRMRTYVVDLARHPLYVGTIGKLRFDPIVEQHEGDVVELAFIRWRR